MKTTGLDQVQKRLEDLTRNAEALQGTHSLSLPELMPDNFIVQHTRFSSLQEMVDAGGVEQPDEFDGEPWNEFVKNNSAFSGWDEMKRHAATQWTRKRLGFV